MITLFAVLFFVIGLLNLFYKDLVWELTATGSVIDGLPSERSTKWDLWMNLAGVASLILAFYFWNW